MNCTTCGKTIVLIPSAAERAKRFGGSPSDYTNRFTQHAQCAIDARNKAVRALLTITQPA